MSMLKNKTALITGASRGIGRAIALKLAKAGVNVVVAAKTTEPHEKLAGTIYTVQREVEAFGVRALALKLDVRNEAEIEAVMGQIKESFGGLDILVNNAGAIRLTNTELTSAKNFDLMWQVNTRATYLCSKFALPMLKASAHAHILNLSPPINLNPRWLANNCAYTITKYGMSLCTLGMAQEFAEWGVGVNALWPKTTIATAAIEWLMGDEGMRSARKEDIVADAAFEIFKSDPKSLSGQLLIDEEFLRSRGVTDFSHYAVDPSAELMPDFFVDS